MRVRKDTLADLPWSNHAELAMLSFLIFEYSDLFNEKVVVELQQNKDILKLGKKAILRPTTWINSHAKGDSVQAE